MNSQLDHARRRHEIARGKPPGPNAARPAQKLPPPPDVFVIAVEMKTIGGTPLVEHDVKIIDPDDSHVVETIKTDARGVLRAQVKKSKKYRLEVVDDDEGEPMPGAALAGPDDSEAILVLKITSIAKKPLASKKVHVKGQGDDFEIVTDEDGIGHALAHLGPHDVEIRGKAYKVHARLTRHFGGEW